LNRVRRRIHTLSTNAQFPATAAFIACHAGNRFPPGWLQIEPTLEARQRACVERIAHGGFTQVVAEQRTSTVLSVIECSDCSAFRLAPGRAL